MREQLSAASAAAHELEPDDETEADYDRTMWLGLMTDALAQRCGPKARVLLELTEPAEQG
jgi:hypothetical protein